MQSFSCWRLYGGPSRLAVRSLCNLTAIEVGWVVTYVYCDYETRCEARLGDLPNCCSEIRRRCRTWIGPTAVTSRGVKSATVLRAILVADLRRDRIHFCRRGWGYRRPYRTRP